MADRLMPQVQNLLNIRSGGAARQPLRALRIFGAGWLLAPGTTPSIPDRAARAGIARGLKSGAGCTSSRASRRSTEPLGGQGYARDVACVGPARLRGRGLHPARGFSVGAA